MKTTYYYDENASTLSAQYDALDASRIHRNWSKDHLSETPGLACDIGAGSGRDANWLANEGWKVIAVEPSQSMRDLAQKNSKPMVTWLDDALPDLSKLRGIGHHFDLILLNAVWMHVPLKQRERAFRILTELLKPSGSLVITLRHGADETENRERQFHTVSAEELLQYAKSRAISLSFRSRDKDMRREHVTWETLVFLVPDDGTGQLAATKAYHRQRR